MGARGFPPAPTITKLRNGETRPSRVNFSEPLPLPNEPEPPFDLDEHALKAWELVTREMANTGIITAAETHLLAMYCDVWSRYVRARELYLISGPLVNRGSRAEPLFVKNPLHQVLRDLVEQERLLSRELGLSASARTYLRLDPTANAASPIDDAIGVPGRLRVLDAAAV